MTKANDFPALDGRVVTEGHAKICRERGHATYKVDGVDQGVCPRCGDVTAPAGWDVIEGESVEYTWDDVITRAESVPGDDGRWKRTILELREGDTAPIPGTTKGRARGPRKLQYDIHPSGILLKNV